MALNKVLLLGNVGQDPKVSTIDGMTLVARFTLATTDRAYVNRYGNRVEERTEWHNIVAWRNTAKVAGQFLHKGSKVLIVGKLTSRKYTDRNGVERYITEVQAESLELLGSGSSPKSDLEGAASASNGWNDATAVPAQKSAGNALESNPDDVIQF